MSEKIEKRAKVYVVNGGFEYIKLMYNLGYDGARNLDEADIVLFTGGEDVNPEMYGEPCLAKTHFNRPRDEREHIIFKGALDRGLPMVGICRGGQFLNVENGGKMWQHVNGHTRNHIARIETPPFAKGGKRRTIEVTSTHHQMMIPTEDAIVLMTACESSEKDNPSYSKVGKHENDPDIEAVFYDDTNCLCFQPHPEFKHSPAECVDFFQECLDNFIYPRTNQAKIVSVPKTKGKTSKKEKK